MRFTTFGTLPKKDQNFSKFTLANSVADRNLRFGFSKQKLDFQLELGDFSLKFDLLASLGPHFLTDRKEDQGLRMKKGVKFFISLYHISFCVLKDHF